MISNLHTHTRFSDGSSRPEKYILEAFRQGFRVLGFSDHSPVPFRNNFAIRNSPKALQKYCDEILRLRDKYSGTPPLPKERGSGGEAGLDILLGLEVDCIPGLSSPIDHYRTNYPFDYFIGSVHLVKNGHSGDLWFIDGPYAAIYDRGLQKFFHGDIRAGVTAYYSQIREMVIREKPDIIGHLDKIKMHNRGRYFSESDPWYVDQVNETLDVIKNAGSVIEVNTRGMYKKRSDSLFPGPEILRKILGLDIPVALTSDAHRPDELSLGFEEASSLLKNVGFKGLTVFGPGSCRTEPL